MSLIPVLVTTRTPDGDVNPEKQELVAQSTDIARALNIQHESFMRLLSEHEVTINLKFGRVRFETGPIETAGGMQKTRWALLTKDQALFVSTLCRNTPAAVLVKAQIIKAFQDAREYVERHNKPSTPAPAFTIPKTLGDALRLAAGLSDDNERLLLENAAMAPKAAFADAVAQTDDTQSIGSFAKSIKWGPNRLFAELRARKILYYREGKNLPMQEYADRGYFKVCQVPKDGRLFPQTTITGFGMVWLAELLQNRE